MKITFINLFELIWIRLNAKLITIHQFNWLTLIQKLSANNLFTSVSANIYINKSRNLEKFVNTISMWTILRSNYNELIPASLY